jgi:D-arabinose 1-dehydrogenase-like Zn-dependent alcohol dehydrogenase
VVKVGSEVKNLQVGDYVSSSWHPAFREYYNAPEHTCFKIPELSRKYILQCVSCSTNGWMQAKSLKRKTPRILIIGSGFTAFTYAQVLDKDFEVYDAHAYNRDYFNSLERMQRYISDRKELQEEYEMIISCHTTLEPYEIVGRYLATDGLFVHHATPREDFVTKFEEWNWKNFLVLFPSPRHGKFAKAVEKTFNLIQEGKIDMELIYTTGYPFSKASQAFDDMVNRRKEGDFKHYLIF